MRKKGIKIIKGKYLSVSFIKFWNKTMKGAFDEDRPLKHKDRGGFSNDVFFIAKDKNKIVSIGRLIPTKIEFNKKRYNILGIADIVSLIKKKRYGTKLITEMKIYGEKNKKTMIGFCFRKNSNFYRKGGFGIAKNQVIRFMYKNEKKKTYGDKDINKIDVDVIYLKGKDKFIEQFIKNKRDYVKIEIPHW